MAFQIAPVLAAATDSSLTETPKGDIRSTYSTIIMQGNTLSASDCAAFETALINSGNGYSSFSRKGWWWVKDTYDELNQRVTAAEFASMKSYHVAYYSGHGDWAAPVINHVDSNINSYGVSSPINVAAALGVDSDSSWQTSCTISPSDPLRVLVLACCTQLNDANAVYYARLMKASGVRVVAGYEGIGPTTGDDTIAANFVNRCDAGYGVMDAWDEVNGTHPWAVLVYNSYGNSDYRLPGFPGATYTDPPSTASIYRYKQGIGSSITLNADTIPDTEIMETIGTLPLRIAAAGFSGSGTLMPYSRDTVWTGAVADDDNEVRRMLTSALNESIGDKICVQYIVTQEEVDTEIGIVPGSDIVVERTYQYFDTYNGIKIADSFISVSIDSNGINNISDQRKTPFSSGASASTASEVSGKATDLLTASAALKLIYLNTPSLAHSALHDVALAYAPDETGGYALCYEFKFADGFWYVNVSTGEIIVF